jgi:sRNA-binding carbon storage regulator CsrA
MGLVLRRNKGQSIHLSHGDATIAIIKVRGHGNIEIDAQRHLTVMRSELLVDAIEPKPVTKKLLQILAENPNLRVWAITRESADCVLMLSWHWAEWSNLEMAWCDGAWSCRPASGVYQQVMVFLPEDDNA